MSSVHCLFMWSSTVCSPPDTFPLLSTYLLFLIALWKWADDYECIFHAGKKNPICLILQAKYGQHNRISSLVSAILPHRDIPMGTHFCCANHSRISAGPVSYLDMKEGEMEEGGVKGGGEERERQGSLGNNNTWKFTGRHLESHSSSFHEQVLYLTLLCSEIQPVLGCFPQSLPDWLSRLDSYTVYVCATAYVTACLGDFIISLIVFFLFILALCELCCCLIASLVHTRSADPLLPFRCRCKSLNKTVVL